MHEYILVCHTRYILFQCSIQWSFFRFQIPFQQPFTLAIRIYVSFQVSTAEKRREEPLRARNHRLSCDQPGSHLYYTEVVLRPFLYHDVSFWRLIPQLFFCFTVLCALVCGTHLAYLKFRVFSSSFVIVLWYCLTFLLKKSVSPSRRLH